MGELEILYTMRDVTDAELTSRVQHLVPWVQDLLDQARERQGHLDTPRQQREAASAGPTAVPQPPPPTPPTDLQALAAQQSPSTGQVPGNGTAPASPADWCPPHQVPMEQRSNAKGAWHGHWLASEQRYCKGKEPCNGAEDARPPPQPEEETTMLRMDRSPHSRLWAIWDDQDLVAVVVDKKGASELLRRLQAPALPPASAGSAVPAAPTAAECPGARQRAAQHARRLAQGSHKARPPATHGRRSAVPCQTRPWTR